MVKPWLFFIGAVLAYLMFVVFIGPENRGAELGVERDDEYSAYDSDRKTEVILILKKVILLKRLWKTRS